VSEATDGTDVATVDLDPCVRVLVDRPGGKPDDKFRGVSLLSKEADENERTDQAARGSCSQA
jgi:hypothetical protein